MVERTKVELDLALLLETPSRITSRASCAAVFSSFACSKACLTLSKASELIIARHKEPSLFQSLSLLVSD